MSAGKEFQTDGAATEKARQASSVRVRGTASSGALDERRVRSSTFRDSSDKGKEDHTPDRAMVRPGRSSPFLQP